MSSTESKQEKLSKQFESLVASGRSTLAKCGYDGDRYKAGKFPDHTVYQKFKTRALNLIRRVCGEDSDHYLALKRISDDSKFSTNSYYMKECVGILEAAYEDFKDGLLFDIRSLILAEMLGDLLEQAETLLKAGYHVPAASLAGAVLEDALKKLCERNKISVPNRPGLNALNMLLQTNSVYDKSVAKWITALAGVRNNADHGESDKVKKAEVEEMIRYVVRFNVEYLS